MGFSFGLSAGPVRWSTPLGGKPRKSAPRVVEYGHFGCELRHASFVEARDCHGLRPVVVGPVSVGPPAGWYEFRDVKPYGLRYWTGYQWTPFLARVR